MRHGAASIEQSRHGVREQRATGRGTRNDLRLFEELRRHHVDQILRDPPDRRGKLKQLVRIQIQLAVKAVAVVEVPFHDDLEPAQVVEGASANVVVTGVAGGGVGHWMNPTAGLEYAILPSTIVAATP